MEFKQLSLEASSIKMTETPDGYQFEGYASVFGGIDAYGDSVLPGAYVETLKNRQRPVRMRWNHYGPVIGKWLDLREDDSGLMVRGELTPGHSKAEDVYASLKHGAVDGLSIGYRVMSYTQENDIRYLKGIELIEISVVEEPADLGAKVGEVKFLQEMVTAAESFKEMEAILREAGGFSRADALSFVSRVKHLCLGEQGQKSPADELAARIRALKL
jgi:HK97 family phage prohead protease